LYLFIRDLWIFTGDLERGLPLVQVTFSFEYDSILIKLFGDEVHLQLELFILETRVFGMEMVASDIHMSPSCWGLAI